MKNELRHVIKEIVSSRDRAITLYREETDSQKIINFNATEENYILLAIINSMTFQINIRIEEEEERISIIMFPTPKILPDKKEIINNAAVFCNEMNCLTAFGKNSWSPNFFVNRTDRDIAISTFLSFDTFCVCSMALGQVITTFYDYFVDILRPLENIILEGDLNESLRFINTFWTQGYVVDSDYSF